MKTTIKELVNLIETIEKETLDPKYRAEVIVVNDNTIEVYTYCWERAVLIKGLLDSITNTVVYFKKNALLEIRVL